MLAFVTHWLVLASSVPGWAFTEHGLFQGPPADFDFWLLAGGLAAISLGGIGAFLAGSFLFGERAEQAKRTHLPNVIIGVVIVGVATGILIALGVTP